MTKMLDEGVIKHCSMKFDPQLLPGWSDFMGIIKSLIVRYFTCGHVGRLRTRDQYFCIAMYLPLTS